MLFTKVDPEKFIDTQAAQPSNGRGAWTRLGIGDDYRYHYRTDVKVGNEAEKSLDHWAVSAGVYAIQARLNALGFLPDGFTRGNFGSWTRDAVVAFQKENKISADGTVGRSDARVLFTPIIDAAEKKYGIPGHYLRGEVNYESALDPGALGYYIYYPDYRGVDRSMCQINSRSNEQVSWEDAFKPWFSIPWSAKRLLNAYDQFRKDNPRQSNAILWEAAICNHNSPVWARQWAKDGIAPTSAAQKYVNGVKAAIY